jgi:TRAP transporter TAXI family solute receptor
MAPPRQHAPPTSRRRFLAGAAAGLGGLALWGSTRPASASPTRFFRIGTASTGGTYFPIGGVLANAISHPPGTRPCGDGGACGVPGLIAVAQSTNGSVDNVRLMASGQLDSGLVQADVAYWAYHGRRMFADAGPNRDLRVIANLYPETVHLVVGTSTGIFWMKDLVAKRLSLGPPGSGTRVDAKVIMHAYGIDLLAIEDIAVPAAQAADMMREGALDGFFFVGGAPANAILDLSKDVSIRLVPMADTEAQVLTETYPFFTLESIPAGTYRNVPQTHTLAVGAQWLVDAQVPADVVHGITRALWHERTAAMLRDGHPKGAEIQLAGALDGLSIPLHPGAWEYYREAGVIDDDLDPNSFGTRLDIH